MTTKPGNKIKTALILLCLLTLLNCTRHKGYMCGLAYAQRPSIESRVLKFDYIALAETRNVSLFGKIVGRDSSEYRAYDDTLEMATISAINPKLDKPIATMTDSNGNYQLVLPPSTYDLKIQFITYNTLIIRDAVLAPGDMILFDALLGQSTMAGDSCVYQMLPDRSLKLIYSPAKSEKRN